MVWNPCTLSYENVYAMIKLCLTIKTLLWALNTFAGLRDKVLC